MVCCCCNGRFIASAPLSANPTKKKTTESQAVLRKPRAKTMFNPLIRCMDPRIEGIQATQLGPRVCLSVLLSPLGFGQQPSDAQLYGR
jgi:hypothetical protein